MSFTGEEIPHISLQYNITGTTRLSNSFSKRLHELSSPIVFLILNNAFLAFSITFKGFKVAILRRQMCNLGLELEEFIFTRLSRFVFKFINFKMAF